MPGGGNRIRKARVPPQEWEPVQEIIDRSLHSRREGPLDESKVIRLALSELVKKRRRSNRTKKPKRHVTKKLPLYLQI